MDQKSKINKILNWKSRIGKVFSKNWCQLEWLVWKSRTLMKINVDIYFSYVEFLQIDIFRSILFCFVLFPDVRSPYWWYKTSFPKIFFSVAQKLENFQTGACLGKYIVNRVRAIKLHVPREKVKKMNFSSDFDFLSLPKGSNARGGKW